MEMPLHWCSEVCSPYREDLTHDLTGATPSGIEVYQDWHFAVLYHVIKAAELLFLCTSYA